MTRSRLFLLSGALLLGFFLVGSVLAVRLAVVEPTARVAVGAPLTLEVSVPGSATSSVVMLPGATLPLTLGHAERLRVSGNWKVVLVPGPEGQAQVTAPSDSNQKLRISSDGTTLSLEVRGNGRGTPVLAVSLPRLRDVEASGAAVLDLATLNTEKLVLETSGATAVVGAGTVRSLELNSSGAAQVDLGQISVSEVWLESSGAANLVLRCDGTVDGQISGAANLLVRGKPQLRVTSSGAAHVSMGD